MHHRTFIMALLLPLLLLGAPKPASAQFDFGSWLQRATIIANQITQIRNQIRELRSMARQLSELENQLDHLERSARGEIEALLRPFSDLAADPVGLVRDGLGWASDFTGTGRDMVGAVRDFGTGGSFTGLWRTARGAADRVGEADILALYRNQSPEVATRALEDYRRARAAADRQRVLDYATLDAAAALAGTIESAQGSFADLTANGNLSNTALQQANRTRLAELARLERLAEWREGRMRANGFARTMQGAALRNRAALREGLLFRIPSFYR
ncbi:MAG: hypothetical protein OXK74_12685 [Gemmatimonadota bacterium]|nr:hypothetical protein [Gemmatimonadota bacterium]